LNFILWCYKLKPRFKQPDNHVQVVNVFNQQTNCSGEPNSRLKGSYFLKNWTVYDKDNPTLTFYVGLVYFSFNIEYWVKKSTFFL